MKNVNPDFEAKVEMDKIETEIEVESNSRSRD